MRQKLSAGVTFRVHDVETVRTSLEQCKTRDSISRILTNVEKKKGEPIFACSGYNSQVVANTQYHPLIGAVHIAFAEHRPLILSPDAIWITILQGLAMHVRLHSQELQPVLVKHTGRKALVLELDIDPNSPESAWDSVITGFADLLNEEVENSSSLLSDFSTTGVIEKLVSQVCLLDLFESFFEYILLCGCGFPEITLTGNEDDWMRLRQKIELLQPFQVDFWLPHLREIADQFCRAAKGDVDLEHWQDMYKQTERYGSDLINGWILKLIPYFENGATGMWDYINPLIVDDPRLMEHLRGAKTDQLPSGMSVVPFRCIEKISGIEKDMEMIGGFVGIEQDPETCAVQPKIGWAIRPAKDSVWKVLNSDRVHKIEPLSTTDFSATLETLMKRYRYNMPVPGEFFQLYRQCNGLVVKDKHEVTWTVMPLAEVTADWRKETEEVSAEIVADLDPALEYKTRLINVMNHYIQVGYLSDGSTVLLDTNRRKGGIYDVHLIDSNERCVAIFPGLRYFAAHLSDIAVKDQPR